MVEILPLRDGRTTALARTLRSFYTASNFLRPTGITQVVVDVFLECKNEKGSQIASQFQILETKRVVLTRDLKRHSHIIWQLFL